MVDVRSSRARVRSASPFSAGGSVRTQQGAGFRLVDQNVRIEMLGGKFGVQSVKATENVEPGDTIQIEVTTFNGYTTNVGNADDIEVTCGLGSPCGGASLGNIMPVCHEMQAVPQWGGVGDWSGKRCRDGAILGVPTSSHTLEVEAPSPGGRTVDIELRLHLWSRGGDRDKMQSETISITVEGAATESCASDADCSGDKICVNGGCITPECTSDEGCGPGQRCSDNRCVGTAPNPGGSATGLVKLLIQNLPLILAGIVLIQFFSIIGG